MQPFNLLQSAAIPLDMHHVDTDMIIPARYLTKISREGYGQYLFQQLRDQDNHFILHNNDYWGAEILIARSNFGCGSSREHAVWALMQYGIKVIIAESFSDIFYNNAAKNGLLTISLCTTEIDQLIARRLACLLIDLKSQTIKTMDNILFNFDYDPYLKECLLSGYDDLDYLLEATK